MKDQIEFWVFALIAFFLIFIGIVNAQEIKFKTNPIFTDIETDIKTNELFNGATNRERDMTLLYGKLDYIINRINELQSVCVR